MPVINTVENITEPKQASNIYDQTEKRKDIQERQDVNIQDKNYTKIYQKTSERR